MIESKRVPDVDVDITVTERPGHVRAVEVVFTPKNDHGIEGLNKVTEVQILSATKALIDGLILEKIRGGEWLV